VKMKPNMVAWRLLPIIMLLCLAACTPLTTPAAAPTAAPSPEDTARASPPAPATATSAPSPTATDPATSEPPTETPLPISNVCSPLEGISLSELSDPNLLKVPFQAPRPGQDDGHHGVDFAYWSRGDRTTMLGHPILSVLDGKVAAVISNRPPYGNVVIIETPLDRLPPGWGDTLPTPAPTVQPPGNVYCPADPYQPASSTDRSLYLLYAHLNQTPNLTLGQMVSCGQVIGEVGTTGKSVNPHLHLETRTGPSGATFSVMAHYDNAASEEEMRNYCAWRISGLFQIMDPMQLLSK
jgi:murein DD-endopeptidase MepM/ murein hydrolase activator NlpD